MAELRTPVEILATLFDSVSAIAGTGGFDTDERIDVKIVEA